MFEWVPPLIHLCNSVSGLVACWKIDILTMGENPFVENSPLLCTKVINSLFNLWEAWPYILHSLFTCPESNLAKQVLKIYYSFLSAHLWGFWKRDGDWYRWYFSSKTRQEFVCKAGYGSDSLSSLANHKSEDIRLGKDLPASPMNVFSVSGLSGAILGHSKWRRALFLSVCWFFDTQKKNQTNWSFVTNKP